MQAEPDDIPEGYIPVVLHDTDGARHGWYQEREPLGWSDFVKLVILTDPGHGQVGRQRWRSTEYTATVTELLDGSAWISFSRHGLRGTVRNWRHIQVMKNKLVGPEREAIEIFPAESRLVDGADQYHLFCLPEGFTLPPARKPVEDRFWPRVDQSGGEDACWPWMGARMPKGYGRIARGGDSNGVSPYFTHRLAYALHHEVDYDSLEVIRHSCDNPPCCNPAHLENGTYAENNADTAERGKAHFQNADRDDGGKFLPSDDGVEDADVFDPEYDTVALAKDVLWVMPEGAMVPYGFTERVVGGPTAQARRGGRQEPFEEGTVPPEGPDPDPDLLGMDKDGWIGPPPLFALSTDDADEMWNRLDEHDEGEHVTSWDGCPACDEHPWEDGIRKAVGKERP